MVINQLITSGRVSTAQSTMPFDLKSRAECLFSLAPARHRRAGTTDPSAAATLSVASGTAKIIRASKWKDEAWQAQSRRKWRRDMSRCRTLMCRGSNKVCGMVEQPVYRWKTTEGCVNVVVGRGGAGLSALQGDVNIKYGWRKQWYYVFRNRWNQRTRKCEVLEVGRWGNGPWRRKPGLMACAGSSDKQ